MGTSESQAPSCQPLKAKWLLLHNGDLMRNPINAKGIKRSPIIEVQMQIMGVCCNSIHGRGALKLNIKGRVIWRAVGVSSVFGLMPLSLREKYVAWPSK